MDFVGADPPGLPLWRLIGGGQGFFLEGKYQGDILDPAVELKMVMTSIRAE